VSVKIRLQRTGTKKRPFYKVVAVDSKKKRDGEVIEYLGKYHPISKADQFAVDEKQVISWLNNGAVPTGTIERLLKKTGIWKRFKEGNISTGGANGV
jgi:small subunit ribosomal protein S16